MRFCFTRKTVMAACVLSALLFCVDSFAQLGPMFDASKKSSRRDKGDTPTTISADSMDLDIANDRAILLGNVDVRDPEMTIKCRKMIIYLGKSEKAAKAADKPDTKGTSAANGEKKSGSRDVREEQLGKEVVQIDCIGDVVITRAATDGIKDVQQAFAGKAVYMLKEDTITMTEDPVVVNGPSRLAGEKIILNTKTERVLVLGGKYSTKGAVLQQNAPQ